MGSSIRREMLSLVCLKRNEGGQGLMSVEDCVRAEKYNVV